MGRMFEIDMPENTIPFFDGYQLRQAVVGFGNAMMRKLVEKSERGWCGWDDKRNRNKLQKKLIRHVEKGLDKDNLVDIANFCMMLWMIELKEELREEADDART